MSAEVTVRIPEALRQFAGGNRELRIAASSVDELLAGAASSGYGALVNHICARDGQLRPFVNVYVGKPAFVRWMAYARICAAEVW